MSMLMHMVLHKLEEQPRSGYGLCTSIEKSTGKRPSYGSIYPLLERLSSEGKVTVKEQGRKKIYSLTKDGKQFVKEIENKHSYLLDKIQSNMRAISEVMGIDPEPMMMITDRIKRKEQPLGGISGNMFEFRNLVFKMSKEGTTEKHKKEINTMLREIIKKLRKMK